MQTKLCAICISLLPWLLLLSASLLQQLKHEWALFDVLPITLKREGRTKWVEQHLGTVMVWLHNLSCSIDKFKWKSQAALSSKCLCCCFLVFTRPLWFLLMLITWCVISLSRNSPTFTRHREWMTLISTDCSRWVWCQHYLLRRIRLYQMSSWPPRSSPLSTFQFDSQTMKQLLSVGLLL